jgi:hypothetical protein
MADRRFFAGLTLTAVLGAGLIFGPIAALIVINDRFKVEDLRSQETRLGESYRTAAGENR